MTLRPPAALVSSIDALLLLGVRRVIFNRFQEPWINLLFGQRQQVERWDAFVALSTVGRLLLKHEPGRIRRRAVSHGDAGIRARDHAARRFLHHTRQGGPMLMIRRRFREKLRLL